MKMRTMKKSAKVESQVDVRNLALIQQLNELEYIWKSQEKLRPRRSPSPFDHLFQNSPRTLMSRLQHRKPALRINKCSNNAVEEILMDRRAAIISGRFKGRQLFTAEECSETVNYEGGRETRFKGRQLFTAEECSETVNYEGGGETRGLSKTKTKTLVKKATLGLGLVLIVLALAVLFCNANNVDDFILFPT